MNSEEPQTLIADLCERFTKIFQEIKDIKDSRQSLESENQELTFLINEEIINHQNSITSLQTEIIELQEVKRKEVGFFEINPNLDKEIISFGSEIENQKIMIAFIDRKRQEINEKTNILQRNKSELLEKSKKITWEIENHKNLLENSRNSSLILERKNEDLENTSVEIQRKYDVFYKEFSKNEKLYKESFEEKMQKEDEQKAVSNEYRELLKKNSHFAKNLQENEKEINRNSEDLKVKIQRLEVLLRLNAKMTNKLLNLEEKSLIYE